jgi:hypothetical protein
MPMSKRITDEEHEEYVRHASPTKVREDVLKTFDALWDMRFDKLWLKLLGFVVTVEGGIIVWLASHWFACLEASHMLAKLL